MVLKARGCNAQEGRSSYRIGKAHEAEKNHSSNLIQGLKTDFAPSTEGTKCELGGTSSRKEGRAAEIYLAKKSEHKSERPAGKRKKADGFETHSKTNWRRKSARRTHLIRGGGKGIRPRNSEKKANR